MKNKKYQNKQNSPKI